MERSRGIVVKVATLDGKQELFPTVERQWTVRDFKCALSTKLDGFSTPESITLICSPYAGQSYPMNDSDPIELYELDIEKKIPDPTKGRDRNGKPVIDHADVPTVYVAPARVLEYRALYISGLPLDSTHVDVQRYFHSAQLPMTECEMLTDSRGIFRGSALVVFPNVLMAERAKMASTRPFGSSFVTLRDKVLKQVPVEPTEVFPKAQAVPPPPPPPPTPSAVMGVGESIFARPRATPLSPESLVAPTPVIPALGLFARKPTSLPATTAPVATPGLSPGLSAGPSSILHRQKRNRE